MTQETAKELLRKTKVIRDNFYPEPIEPEHEDALQITFEFLSEVINYLENDIAKKNIKHAIETIKHDGYIQTDWILTYLEKVLAAIGGDDE